MGGGRKRGKRLRERERRERERERERENKKDLKAKREEKIFFKLSNSPGTTAPTPSAAQALSPDPGATGIPAGRPVSSAAAAQTAPTAASGDGASAGSHDGSRTSTSAAFPRSNSLFSTFQYPVPEASPASETGLVSPQRTMLTKSWGRQTQETLSATPGSLAASHATLGAVKAGTTVSPIFFERSSASRAVSVSHQSLAGRRTRPPASRNTEPCCCPETATATIDRRDRSSSVVTASLQAAKPSESQVEGSCSARPRTEVGRRP